MIILLVCDSHINRFVDQKVFTFGLCLDFDFVGFFGT